MNFIVQGNKIVLCRYKVVYETNGGQIFENVPTIRNAEELVSMFGGKIEELDTNGFDWIDGIEFPKTNMPMEKALEIIAMGEEGYKIWLEQQAAQSPENLAAENAQLKQQLTDTQLALVEVYEMMLPS